MKSDNTPLRFPTIYNIDVSKEEMGIIATQGLIKAIDHNGFIIYDNDNLSGSHIYWSNLKEIRMSEDRNSLVLVYKNMADEELKNTYKNWNELMEKIPEDFGDFEEMKKEDDVEEKAGWEIKAKEMLDNINKMRDQVLDDYSDTPSESEDEPEEEVTPNEISSEILERPIETETSVTTEDSGSDGEEEFKLSSDLDNQALLQKILAEASGSSYDSNNLRFHQEEWIPNHHMTFKTNSVISNASSLGFEIESGGKKQQIAFGKFSDAFYDTEKKALVLEHRYGKSLSFPQAIQGWKDLIQKMPFRFRSFDRKLMWELSQ